MSEEKKAPVITLDGPSGTGKGTIAVLIAKHLNWHILDSGAIYRVLAFSAEKNNIPLDDKAQLAAKARELDLHFNIDEQDELRILLDGEEVNQKVRSESCGKNASQIAVYPEIREALLDLQRSFAKPPGLVTDGRDMGTVVFPDADLKIYLDASEKERARRRYLQLIKKGNDVNLAQVVEELLKRDKRDRTREHSPLKPAVDAAIIDTTRLNIGQVFNNVLQLIKERLDLNSSTH